MSAQLPDTPLPRDKFQGARAIGTVGSRELVEELNALAAVQMKDGGSVAVAQAIFAGQPSDADTLVIGADTYEFCTDAGDVADDAYIGVVIGASAEATLDNLVLAINATYAGNAHPTLFKTDSTTPALANGTEYLLADKIGTTYCRIRSAVVAGGAVLSADPSIALDASGATNVSFDCSDVNMNTLGGKAASTARNSAVTQITITTAMITSTEIRISFPFTVAGFIMNARDASGLPVPITADTYLIDNGDVLLGLGTDLGDTDVVTVLAWD
jgi:hypothetical protein